MALNLLKPALRSKDILSLRQAQSRFYTMHDGLITYPVWTSRRPTRIQEMLNGGSVFWIVNKYIRCRQDIVGFETLEDDADEKPQYLIYCDATLIETKPIEKRPFQGWRYLEAGNAPADIGAVDPNESAPPPELASELRDAGLL
jgi:hypothetical protein